MISALKLTGTCIVFLLLLSITIKGKTLFSHIYSGISPVTIAAQNATEKLFSQTFKSTSAYTKKLFDNSVPKVKDSVKSGLSGQLKGGGTPEEDITRQEKTQLDQLIKSAR